jgi:flagellar biosynthesis chaperone FliJ
MEFPQLALSNLLRRRPSRRTALVAAMGILGLASLGLGIQSCRAEARADLLTRQKVDLEELVDARTREVEESEEFLVRVGHELDAVGQRLHEIQSRHLELVDLTLSPERSVRRRDLVTQIDQLDELLLENDAQIAALEETLAAEREELSAFRRIVVRLREDNELLRGKVVDLSEQVTGLRRQVRTLEAEVVARDQELADKETVLAEQREELAETQRALQTAYVLVGERRELRKEGVLEKRGWLGKARELSDDFSALQHLFRALDARNERRITLGPGARLVELIPPRPGGSYVLTGPASAPVLEITRPDDFWKMRYLVVVVER